MERTAVYQTTYASRLVFSGDAMPDTVRRMHDTAAKKAMGNLMSYCTACCVVTANVDGTQGDTDHVVTWHTRIKQRIEYDTFAARMPSKRTLGKRMHLVSSLKSKKRKNNVAQIVNEDASTSSQTEDKIVYMSCEYT